MKRSRADLEAAHRASHAPYVLYGTALPAYDSEARDDGSYVPAWKQEVRDEQGRKRLHGAFTGGFSAGYFNTVGSKDGWSPSTFVSSRSNRTKDATKAPQQRPEDFMDDEDLADAAEAQRVETTDSYTGLGSTQNEAAQRGAVMGLFKTVGETMGVRLLKRMGWREGQGIGPKVRRKANLGDMGAASGPSGETHLFAPENTHMIKFVRKTDHKGLGFEGETKLRSHDEKAGLIKSDDEDDGYGSTAAVVRPKKKKLTRGGIGIGVLNDTGSDDEDPYEVGPRISYNKVIGGDRKKKKIVANGAVRPVFISKKVVIARASTSLRKCHDGRLPLDGFILSSDIDNTSPTLFSNSKYIPPKIPEGWTSSKTPQLSATAGYTSTADAAKASKLDPKARAALLGETVLPGKSVFDFLSNAARDRLAAASGKSNLPAAGGEIPAGYKLSEEEQQRELKSQIPQVEKDTAISALSRGASGFMPYADDESKRDRYRSFLEFNAGIRDDLPSRPPGSIKSDWLKELKEFANCAQLFKPMAGMMATRFTSASSKNQSNRVPSSTDLVSKPAPKAEDPAVAAAKMGMFGPITRSSQDFYPTRLLCKRFNVRPPAHVQLDPERAADDGGGINVGDGNNKDLDLLGKDKLDDMMKEHWDGVNSQRAAAGLPQSVLPEKPAKVSVEPGVNEALEGERAGEAVFKAIFGDIDDDD